MLTHLTAIRALSMLAFNYTRDDLARLNTDTQFAYLSREKYTLSSDNFIWLFYDLPFASQEFVLNHAMERYGDAALRQIRIAQTLQAAPFA
jgi:hypothetical protein